MLKSSRSSSRPTWSCLRPPHPSPSTSPSPRNELLLPPPLPPRHSVSSPFTFSSFSSLLRQCSVTLDLPQSRLLHGLAVQFNLDQDTFVANLLIHMYSRCGSLPDSSAVFDSLPCRNVFSWNIMISAYALQHRSEESLQLFHLMLQQGMRPDKFTFANALGATSALEFLSEGKNIHMAVVDAGLELDVFLVSSLVNMYGKCQRLDDACWLFDRLRQKDAVVCNAMITACARHRRELEAIRLYYQMPGYGLKREKVTYLNALAACSSLAVLACGRLVHADIVEQGLESDLSISTAIVRMCSDCQSLEDARSVFTRMPQHDLVSWNAMICVNTQHGEDSKALDLFSQMNRKGVKPDRILFVSIISACANLSALTLGHLIHAYATECGVETEITVGNAIVHMYGKCGSVPDTRKAFDAMPMHNIISWTALARVQANTGFPAAVIELLSNMQDKGVAPNDVTFVNVLSACSHAGLVNEACCYFESMIQDYNIVITMEHYSSLIDLFGRTGRLDDAESLICKMSIPPNAIVWESLLSACRVHGDVIRGKRAAEHAIQLDSEIDSPYILLSNIYSLEGRWDDAAKIWKVMFERGLVDGQHVKRTSISGQSLDCDIWSLNGSDDF